MSEGTGRVLVVVPARGGSKGLPGKNLRAVAGVSLVGRAVVRGREFVLRAGLEARARVIVDTDDETIAEEGRRWGADVPFLRPAELARDDTGTEASLLHLLDRLDHRSGSVVLLQPTSPLCRGDDVVACWSEFVGDDVPSAVSVVRTEHPVGLALSLDDARVVRWALGSAPEVARRQAHAETWWPSGAVYVVDTAWFRRTGAFIRAGETLGIPRPAVRSLDVDARSDLEVARSCALGPAAAPDGRPVDWEDDGAVVDARETTAATTEEILARIGRGSPASGVRFRRAPEAGWARVGQIAAVRSLFGLAAGWQLGEPTRPEDVAAIALGAEPLAARTDGSWPAELERLINPDGP